ncbi:MAG TPA: flagellar biosynthesis protein FlhA [Steroidobacteraceae bacterium]|jgi:flagellar biosynthesis protein FlhA|nr:flagellar biosynthesis protein FlhA [Steroidobacteraceae bacterium]
MATTPATTATMPTMRELIRTGVGVPIGVLAVLAMIVMPLPPMALDILFTFNIALSIVIMMAVFYVSRPVEFGVFPTVLLVATLLRLALNVASTRVVLLNGHSGPGAAGRVIQSFGEFVIGGNFAVGVVVFVILTIINFVVVTKGSGRISEVSARFTLDSMPGKQMAIDADLNAGLITQDEARTRRADVRAEADFYGSMDGASKFVRGDAVAGILIMVINILGGLAIGTIGHGMPIAEAGKTYTLLTIGDGLVTQIPALLLSTAVALIVTRMSRAQDMGGELTKQLFGHPKALGVAAGLLGVMGLVPGMPNVAFLFMAALCGSAAYAVAKRRATPVPEVLAPAKNAAPNNETRELSWDDVKPVDLIGLEVGYRLVPLVDKRQSGDLLARVRGVRRKLSQDLGFLVPAVHIRDNLDLAPNVYRINLGGVPVGESIIYPDRELAINPGRVFGSIQGIATKDPAFGMDAVWIEPSARDHAQTLGYTVVDPSTVIATHLSFIVQGHAHEILGHEEVQHLLNTLAKTAPKLVEDLVPRVVPLSILVRVMQGLLSERVPIRNMRTIIETLAEHATKTQDASVLQGHVRVALGRQIVQDIAGVSAELPVITLEPDLEKLLQSSLAGNAANPGLEPGLAERLQQRLAEAARRQETAGEPAVLLVPPQLRHTLARFTRSSVPNLHVLAWNEIPDNRKVRLVSAVGK